MQQIQLVQGRNSRNEDPAQASSSRGRCLNDRVLFGPKGAPENGKVLPKSLAKESQDCESENSAEEIRSECPSSF